MTSAIRDTQKPDTLLLNVAIIPPENIAAAASKLSREAQALGGSFQVDNADRFAHITLYMARFRRSELDRVRLAFQELDGSLHQHAIQHTGYFVTADGYYEVSYARTPALLAAQEIVTKSVGAFRFSPGSPVREAYFGRYSRQQQLNAREWGYDLAGELYRPHVTLTRFPGGPARESLPVAAGDLSFTAARIGLFEADQLGAARTLLGAIDLAS